MPIREKKLMGGDEMGRRIGAVRTMQDEIDMGLRDKDGRLLSTEEKVEETVAQEPETVLTQGGEELPPSEAVEDPEAPEQPDAPETQTDPDPVQ